MGDLAVNEEFLRSAFKGYDINGDGKVTITEFKRIMARTGKTFMILTNSRQSFREIGKERY